MPSKLTRDEVRRVAELAHLALTDAEIDLFTTQLDGILTMAEEVQRIDTTGVPETPHPAGDAAAWREDAPAGSLDRADALANAPDASPDRAFFRVPKVL